MRVSLKKGSPRLRFATPGVWSSPVLWYTLGPSSLECQGLRNGCALALNAVERAGIRRVLGEQQGLWGWEQEDWRTRYVYARLL